MQKKIYTILTFFLILLAGYLYHNLVFDFKEKLYNYDETVEISGAKTKWLRYKFPYRETLFLKVSVPQSCPVEKFTFNGHTIQPYRLKLRGNNYVYYQRISPEFTSVGRNDLTINFPKIINSSIHIKLSNYRKQISSRLLISFPGNQIFHTEKSIIVISAVVLIVFFFGFILARRTADSFSRLHEGIFLLFLPGNILLSGICFIPLRCGVKVAITGGYFFAVQLSGAAFSGLFATCLVMLGVLSEGVFPLLGTERLQRAHQWIRTRNFSDKCLVLFLVAIGICAFLLAMDFIIAAEQWANIAYFILAAGLLGKLFERKGL